MSERLESDIVGDLADATVAIKQQRLGFFDSHPGEVIREGEAGRALEEFAKVKCARVHRFRDRRQTNRVVLISRNELLRTRDCQRLSARTFDRQLIAQNREVSAEDFEQPQHRPVLLLRQYLGVKVSFARLAQINFYSPVN